MRHINLLIFFILLLTTLFPFISNPIIQKPSFMANIITNTVDCEKTTRLCSADTDCSAGCFKNNKSFLCINQKCTVATAMDVPEETYDCNNAHGIYLILNSDGTFHCTSVYTHLYTDLDQQQPYTCYNGILSVNVNNAAPSVTSCKCNQNYKLVFDVTLPHIPKCIPEKSVPIEEFYDVF